MTRGRTVVPAKGYYLYNVNELQKMFCKFIKNQEMNFYCSVINASGTQDRAIVSHKHSEIFIYFGDFLYTCWHYIKKEF